jgi:small GTP-binding protein
MAFINLKEKVVQVKIVYYGPGRGGKTTNLEYIYNRVKDRIHKEMVTIKSHGDRTLFFDFMPLDVGSIGGYEVKVQLYTVPGQVKYNATRKLVLKGVDGVVFVADMIAERRKHNLISLRNLQENLTTHKKSIYKIPLVIQYNKADLSEQGIAVTPFEALQHDLNRRLQCPAFVASALTGEKVLPTLKTILAETMRSVRGALK